MSARAFQAMGTAWWLSSDLPAFHPRAEAVVHAVEVALSRFLPDSALSRLNRDRWCTHPVLAAVTRAALDLRARSAGAFDPTLGENLVALGYDRDFGAIADPETRVAPVGRLSVTVAGDTVTLAGDGALDLGGIAKGWAVARVHHALREAGASWALVDGGGDLQGSGREVAIGVGDDRSVTLRDGAIATSSVRFRAWRAKDGSAHHHILSPESGRSAGSLFTDAVVQAPDAVMADALATALLAAPERVLPRLGALGAGALVRDANGAWWSTEGWKEET